ncbi:MAG: hypothetical protein K5776_08475 [Lachnospiraceae bacterium]|nr:hypothetical protein [Lachnospiraceae bacterium]
MKRKIIYSLICFASLGLFAGCYNAIPEMTEEEEIKVVRYMADAVLEHDVNYQARLLSEEEKAIALEEEKQKAERLKQIEEEEKIKQEEKKAENTPDDVPVSEAQKVYTVDKISEYLGTEDIAYEFGGYETLDKYPKDSDSIGFAFTASDGNKLVIVKINASSVSGDAYVDFITSNPKFKAIINNNVKVPSSKVPLDDVLNFYSGTIAAGEVKQLVLIYEIPEDTLIETLDLSLSAFGKDSIKINLQ